MRRSLFLAGAASVALVVPNPIHQADIYDVAGARQQLPIGDIAPSTRTATETQTFYEVVETVYMTKSQLVPTWVPVAKPQETCDETKEIGCAVCRTIHQCADVEDEWCVDSRRRIARMSLTKHSIPCDTAPACVACRPASPPIKEEKVLPPVINLGITCSLGPGRTVPCELVNKDDVPGPVYRFGEGTTS